MIRNKICILLTLFWNHSGLFAACSEFPSFSLVFGKPLGGFEPIGDLEPVAGFGYTLDEAKPGLLGGFEYVLEEPKPGSLGGFEPLAGFALEKPNPDYSPSGFEPLAGFEYVLEEPNPGTLGDFEPFGYLEPPAGFEYILEETNLGSCSGFHQFGDLEPPTGFVSAKPKFHSVDANIDSLYPHSLDSMEPFSLFQITFFCIL